MSKGFSFVFRNQSTNSPLHSPCQGPCHYNSIYFLWKGICCSWRHGHTLQITVLGPDYLKAELWSSTVWGWRIREKGYSFCPSLIPCYGSGPQSSSDCAESHIFFNGHHLFISCPAPFSVWTQNQRIEASIPIYHPFSSALWYLLLGPKYVPFVRLSFLPIISFLAPPTI